MKKKEIVQLAVSLVILVVAGYLILQVLSPKKASSKSKGVTVEVVTPIPAGYNQDELDALQDSSKNRDFYTAPDLKSGVGNSQPFAAIR